MFDFNKLDKYKKFMQEEGVIKLTFPNLHLAIIEVVNYKRYLLVEDHVYCEDTKEIAKSDNWNDFKESVTNYFLEEER